MNAAEYPVYDFVSASKVDRALSAALNAWFRKSNQLFCERWADFSTAEIEVQSSRINSFAFDSVRSRWTRPAIASPILFRGLDKKSEVQGLIVSECADMLILVMEIFSERLAARPVDRELTSIELSVGQLLFQTAVSALSEGWLDKETLPISLGEFDLQVNNSRLFSPQKEVIVTGFEVRTSTNATTGPARFELVLAKDELMNLLGVKNSQPTASPTQKMDPQLIQQVQVEVAVKIGSADLSMGSLAQLAPGAIIRFDQRVDQPLPVTINGHHKFQAWPGSSNDRACVLIEAPAT